MSSKDIPSDNVNVADNASTNKLSKENVALVDSHNKHNVVTLHREDIPDSSSDSDSDSDAEAESVQEPLNIRMIVSTDSDDYEQFIEPGTPHQQNVAFIFHNNFVSREELRSLEEMEMIRSDIRTSTNGRVENPLEPEPERQTFNETRQNLRAMQMQSLPTILEEGPSDTSVTNLKVRKSLPSIKEEVFSASSDSSESDTEGRDTTSRESKPVKISFTPLSSEVDEYFDPDPDVSKSPKRILYDIAMGKWPEKTVVLDEEVQGTKKLDTRPCSNANCVREAEMMRRRSQAFQFSLDGDCVTEVKDDVLFEDGHLPSYHSMLDFWKRKNFKWSPSVFENGQPNDEIDFIQMWRKCRCNPEAYGIKPTPPQEFEAHKYKPSKSKSRTTIFKSLGMQKSKHFPSKTNMSKSEKDHNDLLECNVMRHRFQQLKSLYPHLPPLTKSEFRTKGKLKVRVKQAEDWHRLVNQQAEEKEEPYSLYDNFLDEEPNPTKTRSYNGPRYAAPTKSFVKKIRAPHF